MALAAACEPVLAAPERAEGAVRALDAELSGELAIGCAPSALATVAAPLVAELAVRHPRLRPRSVQADPEEAVPRLRQRRLDLAVTYAHPLLGAPPAAGTTAVPLFDDPLCLALPQALLHACRNAGFTPRIAHECADLRSGLWLVATGQAVSILPKLLCDATPPGVAVRELPGPGRTLDVLVRAGTETQSAVAATLAALTSLTSPTSPAPASPPAPPAPLTAR
ncbi:LysR substrate-binding domain-containing protein [Streptomyces nojiriensis]|uniref:LysR substrate-binding domain-containing protein n=1 Tax=Streptomyces nojiriensis TaxID=66374 RepID=UPI0036A0AA46